MKWSQVALGRTFGVTLSHGEEFMNSLAVFCSEDGIEQGFIPSFIAAFQEVELVGTGDPVVDQEAPLWSKYALP